jgi:hypothetical protein
MKPTKIIGCTVCATMRREGGGAYLLGGVVGTSLSIEKFPAEIAFLVLAEFEDSVEIADQNQTAQLLPLIRISGGAVREIYQDVLQTYLNHWTYQKPDFRFKNSLVPVAYAHLELFAPTTLKIQLSFSGGKPWRTIKKLSVIEDPNEILNPLKPVWARENGGKEYLCIPL